MLQGLRDKQDHKALKEKPDLKDLKVYKVFREKQEILVL